MSTGTLLTSRRSSAGAGRKFKTPSGDVARTALRRVGRGSQLEATPASGGTQARSFHPARRRTLVEHGEQQRARRGRSHLTRACPDCAADSVPQRTRWWTVRRRTRLRRSTGMSIVFGTKSPCSPDTQVVEESTFGFCTRARVRIAFFVCVLDACCSALYIFFIPLLFAVLTIKDIYAKANSVKSIFTCISSLQSI
ncbi:hypothetical protein JB92DRAFT_3091797, partial [Gautieria morchelliformis]